MPTCWRRFGKAVTAGKHASTRHCAHLWRWAEKSERGFNVTQQDLAVMLGVTRPIVNRALKELQGEGLVAPLYHKLVVLDFGALHSRCADKALFAL